MPETVGYMDATCRSCRKRYGWHGRAVDMPRCPRCGHEPDRVALEHDQAELDNFWELLGELKTRDPSWNRWRGARVSAGLTLIQAARLLEISATDLSLIEQGNASPLREFADRMAACYSGKSESV